MNMKNYTLKFEVDLVYLWADGSDEAWMNKKAKFLAEKTGLNIEATSKARTSDNEELRFSLRSVERYAPWIRKIFIVTDEQIPSWLNTDNPKVEIIDIRQILPSKALPCYNSVVIEYFLYKIPGLSEHFIYANDDMFIQKSINADFFFNSSNGLPIIRLQRSLSNKYIKALSEKLNINSNVYRRTINNAALLIESKYGKYYSSTPHHNIDAYLKSDYQELVENIFKEEIDAVITNHFRTPEDIQRIIFLYYALAIKKGEKRFVTREESTRIRVHKPDYMSYITRYNPYLFCLNDSHRSTDEDRERIKPFLEALFPHKSSFEK